MKKMPLILGTYLLLATSSFCQHRSSANVLIGKWKHVSEVTDVNANGIIDTGDIHKNLSGYDLYIIFNSDGTLIVSYMGMSNADNPTEESWTLERNNTILKMINHSGNAGTKYLHIDNFTPAKMTLKDTSGGVTKWNFWEKQ